MIHDPMHHHDSKVNTKAVQLETRSAPLRTKIKLFQLIFKSPFISPLIGSWSILPSSLRWWYLNTYQYRWARMAAAPNTCTPQSSGGFTPKISRSRGSAPAAPATTTIAASAKIFRRQTLAPSGSISFSVVFTCSRGG